MIRDIEDGGPVAVLASGGADSAALAVELARAADRVWPIFVRFGLRWEEAELAGLRRFLDAVGDPRIAPIVVLDEPVADIYGPEHWGVGAGPVPGLDSADAEVYLPGRNLLLATKAAVWCRLRGVDRLALGSLAGNPFPDSSAGFFDDLAGVLNRGMDGRLRIIRPYAGLGKADVLRRSPGLPWHLTFSCLAPDARGRHCGACNKCAERIRAFDRAGVPDRTEYARPRPTPL